MKTKIYVTTTVVVFLIGVVGLIILARNSNSAQPGTVAQAKAKVAAVKPACLPDNKQLKLTSSDQSNLELAATSQLIDVPAGTNTTVNFATYDGTTATGSELYPKDYGTYNFSAKKVSTSATNQNSWKITSFPACKV